MPDPSDAATQTHPEATREIVRLHDFISGWFRGEIASDRFEAEFADALHDSFENIQPSGDVLSKADLLDPIRDAHGANPDFRISIETPQLIAEYADQIVMTYVEFQQGARNSNPENRRRSTVLFERETDRLIWRHLQETGMPDVSPE